VRRLLPPFLALATLVTAQVVPESTPMDPRILPPAPADGARTVTNPPSFVFWTNATWNRFTLELAREHSFSKPLRIEGIELPMYNHHESLALGEWFWRYRFTSGKGKVSAFGPVRRFTVDKNSIPFPVPKLDDLLGRIPPHPRIYVTPTTLTAFRSRRSRQARRAFGRLEHIAAGARGQDVPPPATSDTPGDPKRRAQGFWLTPDGPKRTPKLGPGTVQNQGGRTEQLALYYLLTGDREVGEAARKWLLYQANFRVDAHQKDRAHHDTVHCYEYGLKSMAVAYDYLHDLLSEAEREAVIEAIRYHGEAAYLKLKNRIRIHLKLENSHAQQDMHELLTTALAVAGDLPEARAWLAYLVPQYVNRIPFGRNDGSYSEGHYYAYKWHGIVQCAAALKTATGIDLFRKPRFANAGRFWLYCMDMNYWWNHFGDNFALHTPNAGNRNDRDGANFLASVYGDRYVKWWANRIDAGLRSPLWYLSDETLPGKPPVDIPQAAVYRDVGWAAVYDRFWDDHSARLFFKSSPWGAHSHAHQDQNSFVIHAFGEILAVDKGYYGYYGDKYHAKICQDSRVHNTILVNGVGQDRAKDSRGSIERFADTSGFTYLEGEAGEAYGERLTGFRRATLFIRPNLWLVFDQLAAPEPATFSFQLNALHEMKLDADAQQVEILENGITLRASHLSPGRLTYRQNNIREHPLRSRYTEAFPEMWTAWCETPEPARNREFLTVLEAFREQTAVSGLQRIETKGATGATFVYAGKHYTVLLRRNTATGLTSHDGIETDGRAVCVVRPAPGDNPERAFFVDAGTLRAGGHAMLPAGIRTGEFAANPAVPVEAPEPLTLTVKDSAGEYVIPLERCRNSVGEVFDFATLQPREVGRYRLVAVPPTSEIVLRDHWDSTLASRPGEAILRPAMRLIVRSPADRPARSLRAELIESHRGQIVNLLENGDFEVGSEGFQPRGWWVRHFGNTDLSFPRWSDDNPASGAHCLKLFRDQQRIRLYSHRMDITEAGTYVIRFKAKATGKGASVNAWDWAGGFSVPIEPSDEWREYRKEVTLKPGLAVVHVVFENAEAPKQTVWVDDMEFGPLAE
jgi:hypothetical protein